MEMELSLYKLVKIVLIISKSSNNSKCSKAA